MIDIIKSKLKEIEAKENVTILFAVESGSRAWGFESPDSDYDVRFIYVRQLEDYLKLEKSNDVIEWQLDEVFDINGWDLKKALQLLYKSNPTLLEWNNSPIIYQTSNYWKEIQGVMNEFFNSKSSVYHYLSSAYNNYQTYLMDDVVILKKYFYVLRPILACKWILANKTPPPVLFTDLMNGVLENEMKTIINELIETKKQTLEVGKGPKIPVINEYLEENIKSLKSIVSSLDNDANVSWEQLNSLFIKAFDI